MKPRKSAKTAHPSVPQRRVNKINEMMSDMSPGLQAKTLAKLSKHRGMKAGFAILS
eukprot:SAG11_NODE_34390_length_272_cov_0.601156_1_plen_55_part_10